VDTNTGYVASIAEFTAGALITAFQLALPTTNGVPPRTALYTGTDTTASIQLTGPTTLGCTSYNAFLMDMTISTGFLLISKQTFTALPQIKITLTTPQVFQYAIKTPAWTTAAPTWTILQG